MQNNMNNINPNDSTRTI